MWERLLAEARDFASPAGRAPAGYDEDLADRIREVLSDLGVDGVREQKMFGGLAFLVGGHMAVAASREGGVLRERRPQRHRGPAPEAAHPTDGDARPRDGRLAARRPRRPAHEAPARPMGQAGVAHALASAEDALMGVDRSSVRGWSRAAGRSALVALDVESYA